MKKEKGITLIALVITIIVLLILAGITITLTMGENGIIKQAQLAGKEYENSSKTEENNIANLENEMDYQIGTTSRGEISQKVGINYSLEETKTLDTWMGKPLYTKTFFFQSLPNATSKNYAHGIENVEMIMVDASKSTLLDNKGNMFLPVLIHTTSIGGQINIGVSKENITFTTGTTNRNSFSAYVTVSYTKTTDTANP